jgi:hypothetical protein
MIDLSKIDRHTAIHSLVGGNLKTSGEDAEKVFYLDGQTPPSDAEIDAEVIRLQAEYDAKKYQRDRTYTSIGDQLDMQYWDQVNGTTTWKDAIAKVKSDNPKPE